MRACRLLIRKIVMTGVQHTNAYISSNNLDAAYWERRVSCCALLSKYGDTLDVTRNYSVANKRLSRAVCQIGPGDRGSNTDMSEVWKSVWIEPAYELCSRWAVKQQ